MVAAVNDLLDPKRVGGQHQDYALAAGLHLAVEMYGLTNEVVTTVVGPSCEYPNNAFSGAHILNQVMSPGTAGFGNVTEAFVNATRQLILVRLFWCCVVWCGVIVWWSMPLVIRFLCFCVCVLARSCCAAYRTYTRRCCST